MRISDWSSDVCSSDLGLHGAVDRAADANALAANVAFDMGAFAHRESGAVDVAFDVAIDLNVAVALQVSGDAKICADDRRNARLCRATLWLRRRRSKTERGSWWKQGGRYGEIRWDA